MKYGHSCIAACVACAMLLLVTAPAFPSEESKAGHKYSIARKRLADLRASPKKQKYRSYWTDCIRNFELVEKKHPRSSRAGDACFDRAEIYEELHQFNRSSTDLTATLKTYGSCQAAYPRHERAPEALYHIIDLSLKYKKDGAVAKGTYKQLASSYPDSSWTRTARERIDPSTASVSKQEKHNAKRKRQSAAATSDQGKKHQVGVVQGIRYWSGGAYTRIVIDQSNPVEFKTWKFKKPDRLVFDFLNTRLDPSVDKEPLPVNDGILKQVRTSQFAPDIVRVVLDLASIKSYQAFPLQDPDRLVIDVKGDGSGSSAAGPQDPISLPSKTPKSNSADGSTLSLSRQLGLKINTIAIDAGHGGRDPGALGNKGLREKDVTLDIARRLAVLVEERLGCTVVMTRDKDEFVDLEARPFIAKSKGADLFVSIHVNASRKRKVRGIETYIQSLRASDRDAMATAARENSMSTKSLSELKSELDRIFDDLAKDDKLEESLQLAHAVQGALVDTMKPINGHVVNLGVKRAFFYVLINTEMPSILAEVGFISNREEEKLLRKDEYKQSIAEALYLGVKKYVDARSPQILGT